MAQIKLPPNYALKQAGADEVSGAIMRCCPNGRAGQALDGIGNPSTRRTAIMKSSSATTESDSDIEKRLSGFIDKFEPANAKLIRQCRVELRKLMPTAIELVYDNYNFFVIGYCTTPRASDCIVSIAAANGVGISFYQGATLADPDGLLQGSGKQNRFIRVPGIQTLRSPEALALINAAIAQAKVPLPLAGAGRTVIQSVSSKQRPRRKPGNAAQGTSE